MPLHTHTEYPHDYEDLPDQIDYIEQRDWDCLLVFDACRWDALEDLSNHDVEPVDTPGHRSTPDWVTSVWYQDGWEDVTYLNGNAMIDAIDRYDMYPDGHLSEYVGEYVPIHEEDWDTLLRTCPPDILTEHALDYDPPIVVHYIQPHTPFIGGASLRVQSRLERIWGDYDPDEERIGAEYQLVKQGHVSPEYVRTAYMENLRLVMRESMPLRQKYSGRCVVTADHGERLGGESGEKWDHGGPRTNQARVVPWLEL